jgi:hypothetical protein
MKRITTALAAAALRSSWNIQNAAARTQSHGERMEAWAHRLAVRWGCVDEVITTVTNEALSPR